MDIFREGAYDCRIKEATVEGCIRVLLADKIDSP
jgi:hypothetical protein